MKKYVVLAIAALLSIGAQAQIVSSVNSHIYVKEKKVYPDYSRLNFDYGTTKEHYRGDASHVNDKIHTMNGFNVGYTHGFNIIKGTPIYLEAGGEFAARYRSNSEGNFGTSSTWPSEKKKTDKLMRLAVPVNIAVKYTFSNGVYVNPYVGLRLTYNISGESKYTETKTVRGSTTESSYKTKWFNEDEMGVAYDRFQVGGQVGLNIGYKMVNVAVGYQWDGEMCSSAKMSTSGLRVGLGVNF